MIPILTRGLPHLILLFTTVSLVGCGKPAAGPVKLAALERSFDENRERALAAYGDRPIIVDAKVASVHDDRLTLETIYFLNVQAYLAQGIGGLSPGDPIRLKCGRVEADEYPTGAKPKLSGCIVA